MWGGEASRGLRGFGEADRVSGGGAQRGAGRFGECGALGYKRGLAGLGMCAELWRKCLRLLEKPPGFGGVGQ